MRQLFAFLISPIPAAFLGGLLLWRGESVALLFSLAASCLVLLYAAQLLVGAAIWTFLRRTGRRSNISFIIGGMAMTGISALAYTVWATLGMGVQVGGQEREGANLILSSLALGGMTGFCFRQLTQPTPRFRKSPAAN